jgi:anti-sigma factor RsiW
MDGAKGHDWKTCKECVDLLMDYLEGRLPAEDQAALDRHFQACPPCLDIQRSYRAVPHICREATAASMPPEVGERLRRFLAEKRSR